MKKGSQIQSVGATALPERVGVAMTDIAENMQEGLLALAVGAGLQVMQALMEADVITLAGPKGKHNMTQTAVRRGRECGSVTLGGRRVPVTARTSPNPAVSSRWALTSRATSTRWRWWRARRRTPPWSPTCWWACGSGA
jgi:hypothetical protein